MGTARYITAFIIGILVFGSINAQEGKTEKERHVIEAFLDETPAIYSREIDLNDFFSHSHVMADVHADEDGVVQRIRIRKCRTTQSGSCDLTSLATAKELLKANSRSVIMGKRWEPGKSSCRIDWHPRHNHKRDKKPANEELDSFIAAHITDETKRMLHKHESSAFIRMEIDSVGRILSGTHIGNIFWRTNEDGEISEVSTDMYSGDNAHSYMVFTPRQQPIRYMNEAELDKYKANKLLKKNAKQIARGLVGRQFASMAGNPGEICIEICVYTNDIEIEESTPYFPGGAKAVKEYYTNNFRYNRILRRNNIKGSVKVELMIKKNGKAKLLEVYLQDQRFSFKGVNSWTKIGNEIYDEIDRITKEMPRWTPGRYDGKDVKMKCSFRIRLDSTE